MRRCAAAIARAVVDFLDDFLMGFFLSCFRLRPRPGCVSSCRDALVSRDWEGEVLSDDEQGRAGRFSEDLADGGVIDEEELRRQADYLKLCGTISETPAELQNGSCEVSLENADECNSIPTNVTEDEDHTTLSEGCSSEEHYILSSDLNIEETQDLPGVNSVPHIPVLETTPFLSSKHKLLDRSVSPFPTPSVLRDDVQTPGTIYTSNKEVPVPGKRVQTRKQFIYPVLRPIENNLHHLELVEQTSAFPLPNPHKGRNSEGDSIKKPKQTSSTSVTALGFYKSPFSTADDNALYQEKEDEALSKSNSDEKHAALSLSRRLRPSSTDNESQGDVNCAAGDQSYDECSLLTERHVASDLNWDVENPTPRLPKTWDVNGIPNTNARYKEDKKVIWHATPFEERLLKVLSDGEIRPARAARGKLFHPEEKAE